MVATIGRTARLLIFGNLGEFQWHFASAALFFFFNLTGCPFVIDRYFEDKNFMVDSSFSSFPLCYRSFY